MVEDPVVYFIAAGDPPKAVKIGHARNVRQRLVGIQTGNHERVRLVGTLPGGPALERVMHRRFAHLHLRGEWFLWSDEIAAVVAANDVPFSGLGLEDAFVGLLGRGYPNSFYRAFVRDCSGQWWRFERQVSLSYYDPVEHQQRLTCEGRAAQTFYGKFSDATRFDGHPGNAALVRLLARARELAA